MFFHEFRADFVLAWELLLQGGDPQILRVGGPSGAGLEGGGAVLEELLLPAVEPRGVDAVLVTQIRDGDVLEEMESQDGDLLLGGEPLAGLLGHGRTSARDCSLSERVILPIPFEAGQCSLRGAERRTGLSPIHWLISRDTTPKPIAGTFGDPSALMNSEGFSTPLRTDHDSSE